MPSFSTIRLHLCQVGVRVQRLIKKLRGVMAGTHFVWTTVETGTTVPDTMLLRSAQMLHYPV
jgi:hypothetical protein